MSARATARANVTNADIPVEKAVLALALPAVGEQFLNASVAFVDTFLVGHLGAVELTATGLANQYVLTMTALLTATAVGSTALIARGIGARNAWLVRVGLTQSALLALAVGALIGCIGFAFAPQLMLALNAGPAAAEMGEAFLRIVSLTMPLTALLFMGNAVLRGAGDTATPLRVMILVNAVNIAVAWALVDGLGPLPRLGVVGVALGASLARGLGGLVILGLLLRGHRGLRLDWRELHLDLGVMGRILRVGVPSGLETLLLRLAQIIFAATVASLGTVAYAAHVIVLNAEAISYMPGMGFAMAATTVVGQNLGAERPDRARRGATYAFTMGAGLMSVMGLIFILFPEPFINLFTSDPAVRAAAIPVLRVAGTLQPGIAASMIFSGALRGAGDTRWPLLMNGLGMWVVRVVGSYVVVYVLGGGLVQVWTLLFFDFLVRGGVSYLRFRSGHWQTVRV